jgi:hypothetical protein
MMQRWIHSKEDRMAKFAHVVTKWIGTGTGDDPQKPEVGELVGYCEDVTGQFVLLKENSPDPNLVVMKVGEIRSPKHDGMINALKLDSRFLVLEEWEVDAEGVPKPKVPHATDPQVKTYLVAEGVKSQIADSVKGDKRTAKMRNLAKTFEKKNATIEPIPL